MFNINIPIWTFIVCTVFYLFMLGYSQTMLYLFGYMPVLYKHLVSKEGLCKTMLFNRLSKPQQQTFLIAFVSIMSIASSLGTGHKVWGGGGYGN